MVLGIQLFLVSLYIQFLIITAATDTGDFAILRSLTDMWDNTPPNWRGSDPCGDRWDGVGCRDSRVVSITLSSMGLSGQLSGDITGLSELQTLDLSYNKGLRGSLPPSFGNLRKLSNLILVGCSFSGPIRRSIGNLQELIFLSLNSNRFSGRIPPSIGNLSKLYWLDLADNQLEGPIPVSNGNSPGLDMLVHTKHFHLGMNQLSGNIPERLFNSNMVLIHVLFESNNLVGNLPSSLGLVKSLEVIRFDRNSLSGTIPSNLNDLRSVGEMLLSNNRFTGPLPDLTGMDLLSYLDMSNNSFDASDVPLWISTLQSLTTLMMERTGLEGEAPYSLFSLPHLQTLDFKNNNLTGALDIGTSHGNQLQLIDLRNNSISGHTERAGTQNISVMLAANPVCTESEEVRSYCSGHQQTPSYSTPPKNCTPATCSSGQVPSSTCQCAYPYTGTLVFRAPPFSDLGNSTYFATLEESMRRSFRSFQLPVGSISLTNPRRNPFGYLDILLQVFPLIQDRFNRTGITNIGFVLSNQSFKPPDFFGPYFFLGELYDYFAEESSSPSKSKKLGTIIGSAVGTVTFLVLLAICWVCLHGMRTRKRGQEASAIYWGI